LRALVFAALLLSTPAFADDTGSVSGTVTVTRPDEVEASPVLVYVVGFTDAAPATTPTMTQKGKRFHPDLLAITAGQTVSFPNGDPFLHNVFSPTASRRFDLGSYRKGKTKTRKFPTPGVVDVFCNIHPEMSATIVVLPNRAFTFADADGKFSIASLPTGTWRIYAYSRRATAPVHTDVTITAGGTATVDLDLTEAVRDFSHDNKYGEKYKGDDETYH
jgi:plastocyanin